MNKCSEYSVNATRYSLTGEFLHCSGIGITGVGMAHAIIYLHCITPKTPADCNTYNPCSLPLQVFVIRVIANALWSHVKASTCNPLNETVPWKLDSWVTTFSVSCSFYLCHPVEGTTCFKPGYLEVVEGMDQFDLLLLAIRVFDDAAHRLEQSSTVNFSELYMACRP